MNQKKLRFAIFGNEYQAKKSAAIQKVLSCLSIRKAEVYMERYFYEFLTNQQKLPIEVEGVFDGYNFDVDYVISLGGDGTFLKAASFVGAKGIPIIGVNMGRLGFLADILPSEVENALDLVWKNEYQVEEHTVIQIEADGEPIEGNPYALNDIAVLKRDNASMISIRTSVNDEYLVTYQADGLIVSTPTGSTAYNLSNGGPIIVPGTHVFSLTAVAPHSLNVRPIVFSEDSEIKLTVESRTQNYLVALDGRSEKLPDTTRLTLRKAPYRVKVIKRAGTKYFHTLREKMMWGADQRG